MFKIFNNLKDAEKLCEEIHKFLQEHCKNYNAAIWQVPVKAEKIDNWYVQMPVEYDLQEEEKPLYITSIKITDSLKVDTDKCILSAKDLTADFKIISAAVEEKIKG